MGRKGGGGITTLCCPIPAASTRSMEEALWQLTATRSWPAARAPVSEKRPISSASLRGTAQRLPLELARGVAQLMGRRPEDDSPPTFAVLGRDKRRAVRKSLHAALARHFARARIGSAPLDYVPVPPIPSGPAKQLRPSCRYRILGRRLTMRARTRACRRKSSPARGAANAFASSLIQDNKPILHPAARRPARLLAAPWRRHRLPRSDRVRGRASTGPRSFATHRAYWCKLAKFALSRWSPFSFHGAGRHPWSSTVSAVGAGRVVAV